MPGGGEVDLGEQSGEQLRVRVAVESASDVPSMRPRASPEAEYRTRVRSELAVTRRGNVPVPSGARVDDGDVPHLVNAATAP